MGKTNEQRDSLWRLVVPPSIWASHFFACYVTVSLWCVRWGEDGSLSSVRNWVAGYTAVALGAIAWVGWQSFKRHRKFYETTAHDFDTPEARHRFLGFAGLLLSLLSAVAVMFAALPFIWVTSC